MKIIAAVVPSILVTLSFDIIPSVAQECCSGSETLKAGIQVGHRGSLPIVRRHRESDQLTPRNLCCEVVQLVLVDDMGPIAIHYVQ